MTLASRGEGENKGVSVSNTRDSAAMHRSTDMSSRMARGMQPQENCRQVNTFCSKQYFGPIGLGGRPPTGWGHWHSRRQPGKTARGTVRQYEHGGTGGQLAGPKLGNSARLGRTNVAGLLRKKPNVCLDAPLLRSGHK